MDDIAFLKAVARDDPAYREALAVLAGGPIPDAVDLDVGGAPATGPVPFPLEVVKHNACSYHRTRGTATRSTSGPAKNSASCKTCWITARSGRTVTVMSLPRILMGNGGTRRSRSAATARKSIWRLSARCERSRSSTSRRREAWFGRDGDFRTLAWERSTPADPKATRHRNNFRQRPDLIIGSHTV